MAEISFRQKIIENNFLLLFLEERALKFGFFSFFLIGIENMIRDVLYLIICFMHFRSSKNQYRGSKLLVYYSG